MLLFIEGTRIKGYTKDVHVREKGCPAFTHGVRNQLDNGTLNNEASVMHAHEQVHGRNNCTTDETNSPSSDGVDISTSIILVGNLAKPSGYYFTGRLE